MSLTQVFIGIDPGLSGAVAWIEDKQCIEIIDTPVCEIKSGKKIKREYLIGEMVKILEPFFHTKLYNPHVFIEKVSSMPKQGVVSTFTFGKGFGIWLGLIAAFQIPYTLVTPQAWKKKMMSGMGKEKDAARLRACQLFPNDLNLLKRKKDIGRADALLIAAYGKEISR